MANLLVAIGPDNLTEYFRFLDELRESGATNMLGGAPFLQGEYPGMDRAEARVVLIAWRETFSHSLPPEDRADAAIEKSQAA